MKHQLYFGVALAALSFSGAAFAQSTGSAEFDESTIVVTASRTTGVGGVQIPDTTKAKGVLTSENIQRQVPGQSILNTINQLPGVNFQNNDPFGSAGGTLSIRGFDASRISLTFDGIPLNDTGNYALYSNQQLDPELIQQVNVNYGSTDVDSPSAAATGSTVNYRTRDPFKEPGARLLASVGDFEYFRTFAELDTGEIGPLGTRMFVSGSRAVNKWYLNNIGRVSKLQANAKIYQPIGDNGDFISVAVNYNENRNNFGGSAPLRTDTNVYTSTVVGGVPTLVTGAVRTPGTGTGNRFPTGFNELPYQIAICNTAAARAGVADTTNSCGTSFDERYNPSNTGNIRVNSRFTLAENLILTVDPSFQYTKANGGGTVTGLEGAGTLTGVRPVGTSTGPYYGVINTGPNTGNTGSPSGFGYYTGVDLNGDGDRLDSVTLLAPSQTQTRRYGVIANLRWDVSEGQTLRLNYSYDRGRHRQTGEAGKLYINGLPFDVFPVNSPIVDALGSVIQKRDRLSYATLNQVSGEYRGEFFDNKLTVNIGVRAPFFQRDLTQNCFTIGANGNVACTSQVAAYTAANPYSYTPATGAAVPVVTGFAPPQSRTLKYNDILPSAGVVIRPVDRFSVFFNYSRGLSVPGTDSLYQTFYYPVGTAQANPAPETTDNFDAGLRYTSSTIQVQVNPWFTRFTNRLAGAFDNDTQQTIYRNLGRVDKYGLDGSIAFKPIPQVVLYAFGSILKSEIKSNVQIGTCANTQTVNCATVGQAIFAATAGKRESGASTYSFGGRIQAILGPVELGLQAKRTGPRYLNDQNLPAVGCTVALVNAVCPTVANTNATFTGTRGLEFAAYDARTPAYTLVDFDLRVSLKTLGLNDKTFFQLNVQNIFDDYYVGGFNGGSTTVQTVPFAQIGVPRTFIGTISVGF